ncbi:MAG: hypothetical protein QOG65_1027, partial [Actinomycetota bacterium]|nr:hypothetical protein [Actinomycetota bacterium]
MKKSVLYIEDDTDNIRLVERLIARRAETTLHVATNAVAGEEAANDVRPDLVLLDNRLPDASAAQVLSRLSSSTATSDLPVVIVTGDTDQATADQLLALGAREIVTK